MLKEGWDEALFMCPLAKGASVSSHCSGQSWAWRSCGSSKSCERPCHARGGAKRWSSWPNKREIYSVEWGVWLQWGPFKVNLVQTSIGRQSDILCLGCFARWPWNWKSCVRVKAWLWWLGQRHRMPKHRSWSKKVPLTALGIIFWTHFWWGKEAIIFLHRCVLWFGFEAPFLHFHS